MAVLRVVTTALVLLILTACAREDEERPLREDVQKPLPGNALEPVEGVWFRVTDENPYGPGQEFAFMEVPVINVSERSIRIRHVEPLVDSETAGVAEVTAIDVAPRPRGERAYVPLGIYHRLPPRSASAGCISQRVLPARGYELEPKAIMPGAILVIRIRTLAPGTFRIRGQRVVYEADGELRYQDLHFEIGIRVRAGAHRRPLHNESACFGSTTVSRDVSLLHAIFATAKREELVESNPAERAERPKLPRRAAHPRARGGCPRRAAFTDEQARVVFLTLVLTGIRGSELQRLRWRDVDLLDGVLRVRESKTEEGERAIALPPTLAQAHVDHYRETPFKGADELVYCHSERGTIYRAKAFQEALRAALTAADADAKGLRPFHDLRHASLTNGAAAGESPIALMTRAGHADMRTTKTYLHLAGAVFREEAEALARRLLGVKED